MNYIHNREPNLSTVTTPDKNNFSRDVRRELVDRNMSVKKLAAKIDRPRETVSRAIHNEKFPHVRKKIATFLKLNHLLPS